MVEEYRERVDEVDHLGVQQRWGLVNWDTPEELKDPSIEHYPEEPEEGQKTLTVINYPRSREIGTEHGVSGTFGKGNGNGNLAELLDRLAETGNLETALEAAPRDRRTVYTGKLQDILEEGRLDEAYSKGLQEFAEELG